MKVRGKRRKLERIRKARFDRLNLALFMLGQGMNQMGMAFHTTTQVFEDFNKANALPARRHRG